MIYIIYIYIYTYTYYTCLLYNFYGIYKGNAERHASTETVTYNLKGNQMKRNHKLVSSSTLTGSILFIYFAFGQF